MEINAGKNEDKVIWRRDEDTFSPQIIITKNKLVGIEVGGLVIIRDIKEWHSLASKIMEAEGELPSRKDIMTGAEIVSYEKASAIIAKLKLENEELRKDLYSVRANYQEALIDLKTDDGQIEQLHSELAEKDKIIGNLEGDVSHLVIENEDYKKELAEKNEKIRELANEIQKNL